MGDVSRFPPQSSLGLQGQLGPTPSATALLNVHCELPLASLQPLYVRVGANLQQLQGFANRK